MEELWRIIRLRLKPQRLLDHIEGDLRAAGSWFEDDSESDEDDRVVLVKASSPAASGAQACRERGGRVQSLRSVVTTKCDSDWNSLNGPCGNSVML